MYAKIIDKDTKKCDVGTGTNIEFYKKNGMSDMEVEQAYNGNYYLKGYAPIKSANEKQLEQLEQEQKDTLQRINEIKEELITAVLLDDADTINSLKAEYQTLIGVENE